MAIETILENVSFANNEQMLYFLQWLQYNKKDGIFILRICSYDHQILSL